MGSSIHRQTGFLNFQDKNRIDDLVSTLSRPKIETILRFFPGEVHYILYEIPLCALSLFSAILTLH